MQKIADIVSVEKLADLILSKSWHKDCEIISAYKPEHLKDDESHPAIVAVRYNDGTEHPPFLRMVQAGGSFSSPNSQVLNGLFWDVYGDDFETPERAFMAMAQSPEPIDVNPITFSFNLKGKNNE